MTDFPRPSLTLVIDRNLYRPESHQTMLREPGRESPSSSEQSYHSDVNLPLSVEPKSLVDAAVSGGVDIVQLRAPSNPDDLGLFAVAMRVRELTAGRSLFVLTADLELAERCHADGLLLPETSYRPSDARGYLRGTVRLVGAFVQTVNGASRAERGGADYVQVGPAFKEDGSDNLALLRKVKDAVHIPVIGFGGIVTPEHAAECIRAGADGVAVTDAITGADEPPSAAALLRGAIDVAWKQTRGEP